MEIEFTSHKGENYHMPLCASIYCWQLHAVSPPLSLSRALSLVFVQSRKTIAKYQLNFHKNSIAKDDIIFIVHVVSFCSLVNDMKICNL